jgi:hypothetical protein
LARIDATASDSPAASSTFAVRRLDARGDGGSGNAVALAEHDRQLIGQQ